MTKEVLYPDDLEGQTLEIDPERINGAIEFWHSDDEGDREELPDGAKNGWWLPVESADDGPVWAAMPKALREALLDLNGGDIFEVVKCRKEGQEQTAPWTVEVAVITDG